MNRATLYEWSVGISGILIAALYIPDLLHHSVLLTVFLFVLAVVVEASPVPLGKVTTSLWLALTLGAALAYGSSEAIWLMIVSQLLFPAVRRMSMKWSVRVFNAGQYAWSVIAMTFTMHGFFPGVLLDLTNWPIYAKILVGLVSLVVVNHGLIHVLQMLRGRFDFQDILVLLAGEGLSAMICLPFALWMISVASTHPVEAPIVMLPVAILGQIIGIYRRNRTVQQIHAGAIELAAEFDIDRICERAVEMAARVTYADASAIFLFNETRELLPAAIYPLRESSNFLLTAIPETQGGLLWKSISERRKVYLRDGRKHDLNDLKVGSTHYRSVVAFPLQSRRQQHGVVVCYSERPYGFPTQSVHDGSTLAAPIAVLVENAKLYQELQEQSWRDAATGLYNHRFFYEALSHRVNQCKETERAISVAVIDVDYFKKFNDTYGHVAGDQVLRSVGQLMVDLAGPDAVVARYGGEEFGLILPMGPEEAVERIEQIRIAVSRHVVEHDGYQLQGITISSGVASCPLHATNDRDLLLKADSAMYWGAKHRGRNHTALYAPDLNAQLFIDELTGLYTYHFLTVRSREQFSQGIHRFAVICFDVVNFTRVNTTFGFETGDRMLREIATVLREALRHTEVACRYGGDEFLVLLTDVNESELELIAHRMDEAVHSHGFVTAANVAIPLRVRHLSAVFRYVEDVTTLFDRIGSLFAKLHQAIEESLA